MEDREYWANVMNGNKVGKPEEPVRKMDKSPVVKNPEHKLFFEFGTAKKNKIVNWIKYFKVLHIDDEEIKQRMAIDEKMYRDACSYGAINGYKY